MKKSLLAPLFAFVVTGVAHSQNPDQPRPDGPPPGPMADRLRHRLEELRHDGKNEEADRLQRQAHEMWEKHRGDFHHRDESQRGPTGNPGERQAHLAEAARQLHMAGIDVTPEMLERLGHHFAGRTGERPPGLPGGENERRRPMPPRVAERAPGGEGSALNGMHEEIRALARQVQELRAMMQRQHGGEAPRAEPERAARGPLEGGRRGDRARGERHEPAPGAMREHHDGPPHPPGEHGDRGDARPPEGRPPNPPRGERPPGDAPLPPPPPR